MHLARTSEQEGHKVHMPLHSQGVPSW